MVVDVYADADEVELFLDGASVGIAQVGADQAFHARIETEWRPGELLAVARTGGVEVGRDSLRTAVGEARLVAVAEDAEIDAEGLGFVAVTLEDDAGTVVVDADRPVTVTVEGAGVLAGLGTGRARTEEAFAGPTVTTYDGRALAIVRPTGPGAITVTVAASGIAPAVVELDVRG